MVGWLNRCPQLPHATLCSANVVIAYAARRARRSGSGRSNAAFALLPKGFPNQFISFLSRDGFAVTRARAFRHVLPCQPSHKSPAQIPRRGRSLAFLGKFF